jgi:hypothetical protein
MVGAAKSGTTSLYYYLRQHPDIFLPDAKECWYFAFADSGPPDDPLLTRVPLITSLPDYAAQFDGATEGQILGECSTAYLHLWRATIRNVQSTYAGRPLPRILITLRNPIERAYSHYVFDRQEGVTTGTFEEAIEACKAGRVSPLNNYLAYGLYADQVEGFQSAFSHVSMQTADDLRRDAGAVVRELLDFLGADPTIPIDTDFRANISGLPRRRWLVSLVVGDNPLKRVLKPLLGDTARQKLRTLLLRRSVQREPMSEEAAEVLKEYYAEDVERLGRVLDRDFSAWLN